uniref:non-specific serine/threonine protein kinase n=1 Tax=Kalanchoe fedtschenkoi TaxID=63787 RepID=A0A7N0UMX8_KALFE
MEKKGKVLMQRYEFGRLLGQGSFAKVYHARDVKTGQSVAIKVIDKEKVLKVGLVEQTKREISVMKLVKHPNVLQLNEVMATKSKIYYIMEYARGGELFNKVSKGRLKEQHARKYFQQLINAIDFCHRRGVYHRDLKPENLLLDENGVLKISDFGLSALSESKRPDGLLHTTCGTPAYVAPEVICRRGYDGAKSDIWSCGVILFVLLAGYLPFHDTNLMVMYKRIAKGEYKCPNWISPEARRLLSKMLDPNPVTRISVSAIMDNPWFRKGLDAERLKAMAEPKESAPVTADDHCDGAKLDKSKLNHLNAFDIISLSPGFDLSGLFSDDNNNIVKDEAQFTSMQPASTIISKLEDVAKHLQLKITKKDGGLLRLERPKDYRNEPLSIQAEIFEFTSLFHLVELKKSSGDTLEFHKLLKEDMQPALGDIIWAWQGDKKHQELIL